MKKGSNPPPPKFKQRIIMDKPKLGQKVRDIVTGIEGIIIGTSSWLTGCDTYGIKPKAKEDGTVIEVHWVDEVRVEILDPVSIFDKMKKQPDRTTVDLHLLHGSIHNN